jgi:uncharacterized membrane protein YgcG
LASCSQLTHPEYVIDDLGILTAIEKQTIDGFIEGHLRESGDPIFVWITDTIPSNFDALRFSHSNFKTVKEGVLLSVTFSTNGNAVHTTPLFQAAFSDSVNHRILNETLNMRMKEGFVFEGIFEATKEISNVLNNK